jgi:hypothetical protein
LIMRARHVATALAAPKAPAHPHGAESLLTTTMAFQFAVVCALAMLSSTAPRPMARYAKLRVVVRGGVEVGEIGRRVDELRQAARILLNSNETEIPVDVETTIIQDGEASISTSMVFSMVVGGAPPLP